MKRSSHISSRCYGHMTSAVIAAIAFGSKDYAGVTENHNQTEKESSWKLNM